MSTLHFLNDDGTECKVSDASSPAGGLKTAAKRYTNGQANPEGLTLFFAHCIGTHKEHWEPVIDKLFSILNSNSKHPRQRIREAWAFDWQNHGDSAVVNEEKLNDRPEGISVYEWSAAIRNFVHSPRMKGHRIVPLGHSAGAGTMMLLTLEIPLSEIPYVALVLIEATMITREHFYESFDARIETMEFTINATLGRRDTWPSKEFAFEWMSKRFPWQFWDQRIVRIMADYGLKDTSTGEVQLKCTKEQEATLYPDVDPHFEAMDELARVCQTLPVHAVWGETEDIVYASRFLVGHILILEQSGRNTGCDR
uniref:AB hydrolase-1 domain-containing protein n=1 Tax=Moniliophthora roreri TaxID=221103 RepID=A0A0W0F8H8_MONRR